MPIDDLVQAARSVIRTQPPAILLFAGTGTSPNDVAAFESLLREHDLGFDAVDSRELDSLSDAELRAYRLLIVPGGNFEVIGNELVAATTAKVREAVRGGMNYLGVCAGAFFAGDSPYNGLDLTDGVRFGFYALEARNVRKLRSRFRWPAPPRSITTGKTDRSSRAGATPLRKVLRVAQCGVPNIPPQAAEMNVGAM